jgi:predicted Ser/Thr protein kinase
METYDIKKVRKSIKDSLNILHEETRSVYEPIVDPIRPSSFVYSSGQFCVAFKMQNKKNKDIKRCYRIWNTIIPDSQERYALFFSYLKEANMEYFLNFEYVPEALNIPDEGKKLPGVVMEWIDDGKILSKFLKEEWPGYYKFQRINVIRNFYEMCYRLRERGIAHGDLSCNNILVMKDGSIRLLDYDSLFVSSMGNNYNQTTQGTKGFQHPERFNQPADSLKATIDDDNFSQLVIAASLWIAFFSPVEVNYFDESHLSFEQSDLENINTLHNSRAWKELVKWSKTFNHLISLSEGLESISRPLSNVPGLTSCMKSDTQLIRDFPSVLTNRLIRSEGYCSSCGQKNQLGFDKLCCHCGYGGNPKSAHFCCKCGGEIEKKATYQTIEFNGVSVTGEFWDDFYIGGHATRWRLYDSSEYEIMKNDDWLRYEEEFSRERKKYAFLLDRYNSLENSLKQYRGLKKEHENLKRMFVLTILCLVSLFVLYLLFPNIEQLWDHYIVVYYHKCLSYLAKLGRWILG